MSVTLSVNSPTGQTPQQIFTVDSLKDADLRKDVPFGGLGDEQSHLWVQSPQNPYFGGLNRHYNRLSKFFSRIMATHSIPKIWRKAKVIAVENLVRSEFGS